MELLEIPLELSLLVCHEEESLSILKRQDVSSVCEKLSVNLVIPKEVEKKFGTLDLAHLQPELLVRYLLYHVYEFVRENRLVYYSFADVLAEFGEECMKSKLRKELYHYQLEEFLKIMTQSTPTDRDIGASRKRIRVEILDDYSLCEYDAPILAEVLATNAYKWEEIALSLTLSRNQIEECRKGSSNVIKLHKVISEFIKNNRESCTLNNIEESLKSNFVALHNEGSSLKENFIAKILSIKKSCLSYEFRPFSSGNVKVDSGKAALLGFQVTASTEGNYQWYKNGQPLSDSDEYSGTKSPFLFISCVNRKTEGEFECREISTHNNCKMSLTTHVSVITQKFIDIYRQWPDIPKDSWPPKGNTEFINLALISKSQQTNDKFTYTIQDSIDDVEGLKSSVDYEEIFGKYKCGALILVEGRPGSGKTTLMQKVVKDWAKKGNVLVNAEVVVLVSLRLSNLLNTGDMTLSSIFERYLENDRERTSFLDSIKEKNGKGLCIIIDGLDEYEHINSASNVISKLIYKLMLPLAMVIVASRPVGTANVRTKAEITQHIEVLGFTKDQIESYVNSYFKNCGDVNEKVWEYLTSHANVLRMCYLPVHAAMVCFLYELKGDEIPQTETKIYETFTISTLLRKSHRDYSGPKVIASLQGLKGDMKIYFTNICKLALDMTIKQKLIVNKFETKFPLSPPNSDKGSLGLVTIDSTASLFGLEDLYTFFHLTFQEFLAAVHLTTIQDESLVIEEVKQSRGKLQMVWKFYCGLVQFRDNSLVLENIMSDPNTDILYKTQCAFESQQQQPCDMLLDKTDTNTLSFKDRNFLPTDYLAISYVLSSTTHTVTNLFFTECTLNTEGVDLFLEKMSKVHLKQITQFGYHKKKCTIPEFFSLGVLLKQLPSIEVLDFEKTPMGVEGVRRLARGTSLPNLKTIKIAVPLKSGSDDSNRLECLKFKSPKLKIVFYNIVKKSNRLDEHSLICTLLKVFCSTILYNSNLQSLTCCNRDFLTFQKNCIHLLEQCLKLVLINCSITDEDLEILIESLTICTHINTLHLDFNRITDIGAKTLSDCLKKLPELTTLSAHCNEIGDSGALCILNSVTKNKKFKLLGLQCNPITENGLLELSKHLECVSEEVQLLINNQINYPAFQSDMRLVQKSVNYICSNPENIETIGKALKCCRSCPELHINDNRYILCFTIYNIGSDGAKALADSLKSCTKLQTLELYNNSIGSDGAKALADSLKSCTELQKLKLYNYNIGLDGAKALADSLKSCTKLQILNLHSNNIGSDGTKALADSLKSCTKLQTLNLHNNKIGSNGAKTLVDSLKSCTKLQTLDLRFNNIGSDGAVALADSLKSCTKLQTLDLRNNNIGSDGAKALADSLKSCTELQTLDLGNNNIGSDGAKALADSLKSCTEVQTLDLGCNNLGSDGAKALADSLKSCTELQTLYLYTNNIGLDGAVALADSLKSCTELQILNLNYNNIGSDGAKALADSLKSCTELQTLNLDYNNIGSDGAKALADSLKSCTELQKLLLHRNKIGLDCAKVLGDNLKSYTKLGSYM